MVKRDLSERRSSFNYDKSSFGRKNGINERISGLYLRAIVRAG